MTPDAMLPMLVAVPLLLTGVALLVRGRALLSRVLLLSTLTANLAAGVALVLATRQGEVLAHQVGGWAPGVAIPLVADAFSALVLTVAALLTLTCSAFAIASGTGRLRLFSPLVLALTAGVNGAFLTGDLFNLFVFVEVMLLPSYGLLMLAQRHQGTLRSVTGSRLYVTFNLFVSTVFLAGVGLLYGAAGTVNLGELAGAAADSPVIAAAAAMCLAAFAMKAAVVPVHGWLARAYPTTSPAVTALFSGLHTKVAIYVIYRVYAVIFEGEERWLWIGVLVCCATMAIGVLGAVGEDRMRSILAFHMVSQIGYILLGVALFTYAGLTAGIFYLLHHMIVKASLFLSTGAIETKYGTDRLADLKGHVRREPWLALAFAIGALSLAGIPPFSGFLAKLTLIVAAFEAHEIAAVVVALAVSLITLLSMLKIANAVFLPSLLAPTPTQTATATAAAAAPSGAQSPTPTASSTDQTATTVMERRAAAVTSGRQLGMAVPAVALAVVTLGLGLGGQLLLDLAGTAAEGLLDTGAYVAAVLG